MDIDQLLSAALQTNASDLHLVSGDRPLLRINGQLERMDHPILTAEEMGPALTAMMSDAQRSIFKEDLAVDFGYSLADMARFRVNAFHQFSGISAAFRPIPYVVPTFEELDITDSIFRELCFRRNGLILVTGPTGSGKSTTLASMVDYINRASKQQKHIITIEDPIEYIFRSANCLIQQREVGSHTTGFNSALRSALREDPDILLVGELRDIETIRLAITAAETGHLVFATLHTSNASKTVYRIIDAFPGGEKDLIRAMLSESLQAVIAQTLMPKPGGGRTAVSEIMICTRAIRNLIREDKIPQIYSSIQTGQQFGMRTFDQHFETLLMEGKVEPMDSSFQLA